MSLPSPDPATQVLVSGASSGIGAEIARVLAQRGHNVALVARRRDRLDALATELQDEHGIVATVLEADLADPPSRTALIAAVLDDERRLAGVCNCAGFGTFGAFLELDLQREIGQLELNVTAGDPHLSGGRPRPAENPTPSGASSTDRSGGRARCLAAPPSS